MVTPLRGEVWTIAGGAGRLTSKPRPVLVMRSDLFAESDFVTVALLTSMSVDSPTRVAIGTSTGLDRDSYVMADKLHTIPTASFGTRVGLVPARVMADVERAVLIYLGIAD